MLGGTHASCETGSPHYQGISCESLRVDGGDRQLLSWTSTIDSGLLVVSGVMCLHSTSPCLFPDLCCGHLSGASSLCQGLRWITDTLHPLWTLFNMINLCSLFLEVSLCWGLPRNRGKHTPGAPGKLISFYRFYLCCSLIFPVVMEGSFDDLISDVWNFPKRNTICNMVMYLILQTGAVWSRFCSFLYFEGGGSERDVCIRCLYFLSRQNGFNAFLFKD